MAPPIAFVEDKHPNLDAVTTLLEESAAANHWTNYGPVWAKLKAQIESKLQLPPDRCAIPSASGTHALMAAVALAAKDGVSRWVVSSYGFRATIVGPLAGAMVVDCDGKGVIDLAAVGAIDSDDYDGIVATNPFGIFGDLDDVVAFARRAGKALIIDNAAGFVGFNRSDQAGVYECLSFHHTKPYGFGEGGCLIVDQALAADARAAMDFGYHWPWPAGQGALSNGKLSDPAAAFILARHQDDAAWAPAYKEQFWRVLDFGERHGLGLLGGRGLVGPGVHGNVPLLCPEPVSLAGLENARLKLLKYYKPIGAGPVSNQLYDRIVNVPCHPGVATLGDYELEELMACIRTRTLAG